MKHMFSFLSILLFFGVPLHGLNALSRGAAIGGRFRPRFCRRSRLLVRPFRRVFRALGP